MTVTPHPLYSPDLAPPDFYLFDSLKGCLAGLSFENADELLERVRRVLSGIENVTFRAVFLECMERLRKCMATNSQSVE
jgi:hypothetical protein